MTLMQPQVADSSHVRNGDTSPLRGELLEAESRFYQGYPWCLNPFLTVAEAIDHLREELGKSEGPLEDWQLTEVRTNIFLLSCGILNAVEDYLHGGGDGLSRALALLPWGNLAARTARKLGKPFQILRLRTLGEWQEHWKVAVDEFLQLYIVGEEGDVQKPSDCHARLSAALPSSFPPNLQRQRLRVPSAFLGQDLTPWDILKLGQKWELANPNRQRQLVIIGLRTAGSYFAPLLRAYLATEGYGKVDMLTIRPRDGANAAEMARLKEFAKRGDVALMVDDCPVHGTTAAAAQRILLRAGFDPDRISALLPVHLTCREWAACSKASSLAKICILTLDPADWHKQQLLRPERVEKRLQEYFANGHFAQVRVVESKTARRLNARLQGLSEETRQTSFKRIYEVHLQTAAGQTEIRYILAKSAGWGWLAYRAFLAGERLSRFVPPILGMREGILYSEWLPQRSEVRNQESEVSNPASEWRLANSDRISLVRGVASYVAARARSLGLGKDPSADLHRDEEDLGRARLCEVFRKAFASHTAGLLQEPRIRAVLFPRPCPCPTLIDGKMRRVDWIKGSEAFLKTDFEHHGLGKHELNVVDPAYDLAEAILHLGFSPGEEKQLLDHYREQCPDTEVDKRLFLNKLLAGVTSLGQSLRNLQDLKLAGQQREFHRQYLAAWNFLTWETARFWEEYCSSPQLPQWGFAIAVLDIDGVLDRRTFGFPCANAAGMRALSLLHHHDFAVLVDTARSALDVQKYCQAYSLAGGVAEYGSYIWDAVAGHGRPRVSSEALAQLEKVRDAIQRIPGMFVDSDYQYSVRAFTYDKAGTKPLPTPLVQRLLARLKVDRLRVRQNAIDTAFTAKEVDKGNGLVALLDWVGQRSASTVAIGDSEPDLPMFSVANRSFAPLQISCAKQALELGCRISDRAYQDGLLEIVRTLVHPDGKRCRHCETCERSLEKLHQPLFDLFDVADTSRTTQRLRALVGFVVFRLFHR